MTRGLGILAAAMALAIAIAAPVEAAGWTTKISSLTTPVARGHYASAVATTHAGAHCSITVTYKSGPSHAAGLGSKTATSKGRVSWSWKVGTNTTKGLWPLRVSCTWGGVTRAVTKSFRVK